MKLNKGYTLIHEHIKIDLSKVKNDQDTCYDSVEEVVKEMKILKNLGVGNILEVTNIGMGRSLTTVKKVEDETGIKILMSTGFYKEPFLPEYVCDKTIEELAEIMINECMQGIDGTDRKAVCIGEIGTSKDMMKPMERKVFDAAILAAKKCSAVISTHTSLGTCAAEQASYLISNGILPSRIIIGHMDLTQDLARIKEVLDLGVNIGFDTIGKNNYFPDEKRVEFLLDLEKEGYLNQVMLSMDLTRKSHLKCNGGLGYAYLIEEFLPMLRLKGMKEDSINQMLVKNPIRLFSQVEEEV